MQYKDALKLTLSVIFTLNEINNLEVVPTTSPASFIYNIYILLATFKKL